MMKLSYDVISFNSADEFNLPPLIFLHGLLDSRITWKRVAPAIAKRTKRKAYVLDARNHGQSPRSTDMDYEVLTKDLEDFMDGKGIKTAVIVGHSMGGRTAINFALKHPDRTDALIIEDMTPRNVTSDAKSFVYQMANLTRGLLESVPPELDIESTKRLLVDTALSFIDQKYADVDRVRHLIEMDMIPIKKVGSILVPDANFDVVISMLTTNALVQDLPDKGLSYTGDALFLYGSKPFFDLGKDRSVEKLFPRALKRKIEGSTHYIHVDNSEIFVQVVSDFILDRKLPQSKY